MSLIFNRNITAGRLKFSLTTGNIPFFSLGSGGLDSLPSLATGDNHGHPEISLFTYTLYDYERACRGGMTTGKYNGGQQQVLSAAVITYYYLLINKTANGLKIKGRRLAAAVGSRV